jgi:hypothetical protein
MHSDATTANEVDSEGGGANPQPVQQDSLITVPVNPAHRLNDFACTNSERVAGFFAKEMPVLVPNYCRLFIAPNPADPTHVWGFYTLSAALLMKQNLTGSDEKRVAKNYMGYPAPMVRIGFMGRDDSAPKGFGAALIVDAARRVHRNGDIAAWGLVLESEGGAENAKLWKWYEAQGFKACRGSHPHSMYGSLTAFLPELQPAPQR